MGAYIRLRDQVTRRSVVAVAAAGAATFAAGGVPAVLSQDATPVHGGDEVAFLFVVSGFSGGTFGQSGDGSYHLTLNDAPDQAVYFSDRPNRLAGVVSTAQLMETVSDSAGPPPNATLAIQLDDERVEVLVFELGDAAYDAAAATLTVSVVVLDAYQRLAFDEAPLSAARVPASFGPSTLFIDDIPWNPGGFGGGTVIPAALSGTV